MMQEGKNKEKCLSETKRQYRWNPIILPFQPSTLRTSSANKAPAMGNWVGDRKQGSVSYIIWAAER
jgi:hypothetical protein